ncbi:MAG TPA: zf-TFIIB domain-containing protein [Candidatus Saccharimonadales bacterium]|nr:zf-TFIIB domain-containing protein [Candidatus Saccharimonadales bacterium]
MKCPNDNATLLITDRNGIEIDYCPECRGVWLDRGELDKLIERSGQMFSSAPRQEERRHDEYREESHYSHDNNRHHNDHHKKHKRENPFEDFFDFG